MGNRTGRSLPRRSHYTCESCGVEQRIGPPRAASVWVDDLRLSEEQWERLLVAAAEYRDLSADASEDEHAVDFVDWIRPEVIEVEPGMTFAQQERQERGLDLTRRVEEAA